MAGLSFAIGCATREVIESPPREVGSIEVSPTDQAMISMGQELPFNAIVRYRNGALVDDPAVEWSSSDESVLEVDADGIVLGVGGGVASVVASVASVEQRLEVRVLDLTGTWVGGEDPDEVRYTLTQTGTSVPGSFESIIGFPPITDVNVGTLSGTLTFARYAHVLTVITETNCRMRINGSYDVHVDEEGELSLVRVGTARLSSPNCTINGTIRLATLRRE